VCQKKRDPLYKVHQGSIKILFIMCTFYLSIYFYFITEKHLIRFYNLYFDLKKPLMAKFIYELRGIPHLYGLSY